MNEIVILGAGYAGMTAALAVARRTRRRDDVHIRLVNPQSRFTERLRLHQIASGQELADLQIPAMLTGTAVEFVRGSVTAIDADAHTVRVDDALTLRYDTLIYAMGAVADTDGVPGADGHAFTLDNAGEAELLALTLGRTEEGTVAVIGGGLTGVESAAEIAEQHPHLRVVLLSNGDVAPMTGEKARARLLAGLTRLGVQVRGHVDVTKVLPGAVELAGGEELPTAAVLWTAGVRVPRLAAEAGLETDDRGRIVTDPALRSVSHPDVWAVGDAAAVPQSYGVMHGTCQGGIPSAAHAAASIARTLKGKQPKPFRFGYIHQPVSLGRHDAVIQFTRPDDTPNRFRLTGRWAAAYKETVSSSPWPTFRLLKVFAAAVPWRRGGRNNRVW
jgi:NADH dehydrogenase FAD-containing subunit